MKTIQKFLDNEIYEDGYVNEILMFINNESIRCGEFECNTFIIKKMSTHTFFVYEEFPKDNYLSINHVDAIFRKELQKAIVDYCELKDIPFDNNLLL